MIAVHTSSVAQQLDIKHYNVEDGLTSENITTVLQSDDGYMWFGTYGSGLFRFNGLSSKQFRSPQGVSKDTVEVVFQDSKKRIWAANSNGGVKFITQDSVFNAFLYQPINYSTIKIIRESPEGSLWFGTKKNGLFIWRDDHFRHITAGNSNLQSNRIQDIVIEDSSSVWIATASGLSRYNGTTLSNVPVDFKNFSPRNLFLDHQKRMWIGTAEGLFLWDKGTLIEITDSQDQSLGEVTDIIQNRKGNLVVGTARQGILIFGDETTTKINTSTGLNSNRIKDLYLDAEDKIWIITDKGGAFLLRDEAFMRYTDPLSPAENTIYSIEEGPDHSIWFASNQGLMKWQKGSYDGLIPLKIFENTDIQVTDMARYPQGDILLLTMQRKLIRTDGKHYSYLPEGMTLRETQMRVFDIMVNSHGEIVAGTSEGVFYFSNVGLIKYDTSNGLPHNYVWDVMEDRQKKLWFSTSNGLSVLDDGRLQQLSLLEKLGSGKYYRHAIQDEEGDYWLGTNEGIIYYHLGTDSTSSYIRLLNNQDGLLSVDTQFLIVDNEYLWHGTAAGLHKISTKQVKGNQKIKVVHYGLASRGLGTSFSHDAAINYGKGKFWFGSVEGAIHYDAEANQIHNSGPVIHITDVELSLERKDGKRYYTSVLSKNTNNINQETFSHLENNLSFDFQALDYNSPEKVLYQYKLEGADSDWSFINSPQKINYNKLPPGSYTFQVKARNSYGVWSAETADYSFSINPPFRQTGWFLGLSVLMLLGTTYGGATFWLHTYEKKRLSKLVDKQTVELQKGLQEKEVLLAEIHHRVKNNLAVISGLVELQKAKLEDPKAIRAMTETQNRVHAIAMIHEKIYKSELFSSISLDKYVNELAEVTSNSYNIRGSEIQIKVETDEVQVTLDQSIPCGLILNELLCNAYEHAFIKEQDGEIKVSLKEVLGMIHLEVSDDGIGLPDDFDVDASTSLGLKLVSILTKQLQGELTIQNQYGSTFHLSFPKKTTNYSPLSKSSMK